MSPGLLLIDGGIATLGGGIFIDTAGTDCCCEPGQEQAACCLPGGTCANLTAAECAQIGGTHFPGQTCAQVDCRCFRLVPACPGQAAAPPFVCMPCAVADALLAISDPFIFRDANTFCYGVASSNIQTDTCGLVPAAQPQQSFPDCVTCVGVPPPPCQNCAAQCPIVTQATVFLPAFTYSCGAFSCTIPACTAVAPADQCSIPPLDIESQCLAAGPPCNTNPGLGKWSRINTLVCISATGLFRLNVSFQGGNGGPITQNASLCFDKPGPCPAGVYVWHGFDPPGCPNLPSGCTIANMPPITVVMT